MNENTSIDTSIQSFIKQFDSLKKLVEASPKSYKDLKIEFTSTKKAIR